MGSIPQQMRLLASLTGMDSMAMATGSASSSTLFLRSRPCQGLASTFRGITRYYPVTSRGIKQVNSSSGPLYAPHSTHATHLKFIRKREGEDEEKQEEEDEKEETEETEETEEREAANLDGSSLMQTSAITNTIPSPEKELTPRGGGGLSLGFLKWPLWLMGPTVLLATGAVPILWLPISPLFEGSYLAGLLSLAGLDGMFNLGASLFLLIANFCAQRRPNNTENANNKIPLGYKLWSFLVIGVGLLGALLPFIAAKKGGLDPALVLPPMPIAALLGPYLALLVVQFFGEVVAWQWQSPVWAILPLVYNSYRLLQLARGLQLGSFLSAPFWLCQLVKGLIAWWAFALGVHLIWITWFIGKVQNSAYN